MPFLEGYTQQLSTGVGFERIDYLLFPLKLLKLESPLLVTPGDGLCLSGLLEGICFYSEATVLLL